MSLPPPGSNESDESSPNVPPPEIGERYYRQRWWKNPGLSLGLSVAAFLTSALGLGIVGVPNRGDIHNLQLCMPVVVQVEQDDLDVEPEIDRVLSGEFKKAEAQDLLLRFEKAKASMESALDTQALRECLDPVTLRRVASTVALLTNAINVLRASIDVIPAATPSAQPTPR